MPHRREAKGGGGRTKGDRAAEEDWRGCDESVGKRTCSSLVTRVGSRTHVEVERKT